MSFSSVERPDTTEARQGPSPTAQLPPLCKKTPAPSGYRAREYILVYVVEGHASACPRTGGVDKYGGVDIKKLSLSAICYKRALADFSPYSVKLPRYNTTKKSEPTCNLYTA